MSERIQKIISSAGMASRRAAEELIRSGRVCINGETAKLGQSADLNADIVTVDGEPLKLISKKVYIMLNKPRGYVTTVKDDRGRPTVMDLISEVGERVYPVGRLDMDSEGLLILTNDGEVANRLMHPSFGHQKTYIVKVTGKNIGNVVKNLMEEINIDGVTVRAKKVELIRKMSNSTEISITIGEGRNRQVRKMCTVVGLTVVELKRVSEGFLELGDLPSGKWRYLSAEEIEHLQMD